MASEYPRTTYIPEVEEAARKDQERRVVQEGMALWTRQKNEVSRQKYRGQRELREMLAKYSPWGKPGGGAPCASSLRKKNVRLEPSEPAPCSNYLPQGWNRRKRSLRRDFDPQTHPHVDRFYDERSTRGMIPDIYQTEGPLPDFEHRNSFKEAVEVYELTGGVELVPLLKNGRYHRSMPQTTRYLATDATRPGYTIESLRALGVGNREYLLELAQQIHHKRENIMEDQRRERESCRRHFDTWQKLWGRPGHGAPIDHVQRNNLHNILYHPAVY